MHNISYIYYFFASISITVGSVVTIVSLFFSLKNSNSLMRQEIQNLKEAGAERDRKLDLLEKKIETHEEKVEKKIDSLHDKLDKIKEYLMTKK